MLSKRLNKIVNFVKNDNGIADIGSDHGYVLFKIREKGFMSRLLGVENKKAPFLRLQQNIKKYKVTGVDAILSDGLDDMTSEYKTIIIAGMGFDTIKMIVTKNINKISFINNFVIDAHTDKAEVRPFFTSLGYKIINEEIIFEDGIYYDLISFEKCESAINYSKVELEFGPYNISNKPQLFKDMLNSEIQKNTIIIEKINNLNSDKSKMLTARNEYLRGILNEN